MADLFGRNAHDIKTPLTADRATISWGGIITGAMQLSVNYNQPITRRRSIGNKAAIIYAGYPIGQIQIQRLLTTDSDALFNSPGWDGCRPGTISIGLGGGCGDAASSGGYSLTATGVIVTNFSLNIEAEGLTVMDNVAIEFLQLLR